MTQDTKKQHMAELRVPENHGESVEYLLDAIDTGNDYPGFQVEYVGVTGGEKVYKIHEDN